MKEGMSCIGLLFCVGCGVGAVPPSRTSSADPAPASALSLSAHSDEELQRLAIQTDLAVHRAVDSGNTAEVRRALNELLDVYEEMLSRPSLIGDATESEIRALRQYFEFVRDCVNGACPDDREVEEWLAELSQEGGYNDVWP